MKKAKSILTKHSASFSKFTFVGGVFYFLATIGNGFAIDYLRMDALTGASIVMGILFILKYWAYRLVGVMNADFLTYCLGSIVMTLLGVLFVWLLVDFVGLTGAVSTVIIYGSIFVLRYFAFSKLKLIKH